MSARRRPKAPPLVVEVLDDAEIRARLERGELVRADFSRSFEERTGAELLAEVERWHDPLAPLADVEVARLVSLGELRQLETSPTPVREGVVDALRAAMAPRRRRKSGERP